MVEAISQSSSAIAEVTENAAQANVYAQDTARLMASGREDVAKMVAKVEAIARNSVQISAITDVIGNIAEQTNLLALNAAIEAARAGESGRGFAVVADEVRNLAVNSAKSVKEITQLVESAVKEAKDATGTTSVLEQEIDQILGKANDIESILSSVAVSIEQQSQGLVNLRENANTLLDIGERNATAAEEVSVTATELSQVADQTRGSVQRFQLK
jgi:methyl-accepting chemotaxis protein